MSSIKIESFVFAYDGFVVCCCSLSQIINKAIKSVRVWVSKETVMGPMNLSYSVSENKNGSISPRSWFTLYANPASPRLKFTTNAIKRKFIWQVSYVPITEARTFSCTTKPVLETTKFSLYGRGDIVCVLNLQIIANFFSVESWFPYQGRHAICWVRQ